MSPDATRALQKTTREITGARERAAVHLRGVYAIATVQALLLAAVPGTGELVAPLGGSSLLLFFVVLFALIIAQAVAGQLAAVRLARLRDAWSRAASAVWDLESDVIIRRFQAVEEPENPRWRVEDAVADFLAARVRYPASGCSSRQLRAAGAAVVANVITLAAVVAAALSIGDGAPGRVGALVALAAITSLVRTRLAERSAWWAVQQEFAERRERLEESIEDRQAHRSA